MENFFNNIKSVFPKAIVQFEKNYVSFTFGGGLYYQLRVQKDKVRMMATNYPAKAKLGECIRVIKSHKIEGKEINGKEIIFEIGLRNPEIFTLRLEIPYQQGQLEKNEFIDGVIDSCNKFHEALLPLVNKFLKKPAEDLTTLMGGYLKSAPKLKSQGTEIVNHSMQFSNNIESAEDTFSEMLSAFKNGDFKRVEEFIKKGLPPLQFNSDDSVIENELISVCAAEEVNLALLNNIIKRGDDLNARNTDQDKYTAIHYCAWDGKIQALVLLLNSGADPDIVGADGRTALHLATALGHSQAIKLLLNAGVDINRRIPDSDKYYSKNGATALREALLSQSWEIIDLLLDSDAETTTLTEPCVESYDGENDVFEVIRLLARDGGFSDGIFDEDKLRDLEMRVKGVVFKDKSQLNEQTDSEIEYVKGTHQSDDLRNELLLSDFDIPDSDLVNLISKKIKNGKILTNLLYINSALAKKGYDIDNHQTYFFDSCVLISDRELEGFLVVNMDGFYSNCMNEDEMSPIFSWGGVKDIKYEDNGDDCSIDIVSDQGILTIKKYNSQSLKILFTFYKYVWQAINKKFKNQPFIIWNEVWDMGIKEVGFQSFIDYCSFEISQYERPVDEAVLSDEQDKDEFGDKELSVDPEDPSFYIGTSYENQYLRFHEIADKTGILINQINVEPNTQERDELWDIVRNFVERIYQLDDQKASDKEEINTLCFYSIVALHWCDLTVNDKQFSLTNGRFRRDTIALALCLYGRIDRSYYYYDHVKLQFIMPHIQFSFLLWSVNSIVNLGKDNLFGIFSQEQAQKAQQLFTELDKKNQESGGHGYIDPRKMPDNHPLRAIWHELFTLFNNVRIPYQFIRNYINLESPKQSFLKNLLTRDNKNSQGENITLLPIDKQSNINYLDKQIKHRLFPIDWSFIHDIAFVSIYFATMTDSEMDNEEKKIILTQISEWMNEDDQNNLEIISRDIFNKSFDIFEKDKSTERFLFSLESIKRHILIKKEFDVNETRKQLQIILDDLLSIAEASGEVKTDAIDLVIRIRDIWGIVWNEVEEQNNGISNDNKVEGIDDEGLALLLSSYGVESENEFTSLSLEQATQLVKYNDALCLNGLTDLTEEIALVLATHRGNIILDGITSLSDDLISILARHEGGYLSLDGLNSISDKSLEVLAKTPKHLYLNGLTTLTDRGASLLAIHNNSINLDGIIQLSDKAIASLSKHHWGYLSLNGLNTISEAGFAFWGKHNGDLYLNGLTKLTDKGAESLSKHKGDLFLDGITSLSDKAAISLSKHEGALSMDGLITISKVAAKALSAKGIQIKKDE